MSLRTQGLQAQLRCDQVRGYKWVFKAWNQTEVGEARRLIEICFEADLNLSDTANGYSYGRSEEVSAMVLKGNRDPTLISTKAYFPIDDGLTIAARRSTIGAPRSADSLRRLKTDYIDITSRIASTL